MNSSVQTRLPLVFVVLGSAAFSPAIGLESESTPRGTEAITKGIDAKDINAKDIDLLGLLDLSRDFLSGEWKVTKDGLWVEGGDRPKLVLPISPRVDYEVQLHFRMKYNHQFAIALPLNPGMTLLWVSAAHKGSEDTFSLDAFHDARPYV